MKCRDVYTLENLTIASARHVCRQTATATSITTPIRTPTIHISEILHELGTLCDHSPKLSQANLASTTSEPDSAATDILLKQIQRLKTTIHILETELSISRERIHGFEEADVRRIELIKRLV